MKTVDQGVEIATWQEKLGPDFYDVISPDFENAADTLREILEKYAQPSSVDSMGVSVEPQAKHMGKNVKSSAEEAYDTLIGISHELAEAVDSGTKDIRLSAEAQSWSDEKVDGVKQMVEEDLLFHRTKALKLLEKAVVEFRSPQSNYREVWGAFGLLRNDLERISKNLAEHIRTNVDTFEIKR